MCSASIWCLGCDVECKRLGFWVAWGCSVVLGLGLGLFGVWRDSMGDFLVFHHASKVSRLPIGPKVVPFWGSYLEFYMVIPKRNYFGAYG